MTAYFVCLFGASLLAMLGNHYRINKLYSDESDSRWVPTSIIVILIFCIFSFMYAFRWRVGTDFSGYYHSFTVYGESSLQELFGGRDWGFSVLSHVLFHLFNGNYQYYNLVLAIITYAPVLYIYRKYSDDFGFTIFLYMTTLACFWPYNGVRQSLAGSICFLAFDYLVNKKYIKYVVCVLIASIFHSTALIMLPIMFYLCLKPWKKKMIMVTLGLLISVVFLGTLWSHIINFLELIEQDKMVADYGYATIASNAVNGLRIIVAMIPVVLSFMIYLYGLDEDDRTTQILENMIVLSAVFMIAASRLTVLARFSSYFAFAVPLLFVKSKQLFTSQSSRLYVAIVMVCYIAYFAVLLPVESNLVPYQWSFSSLSW